MTSSESPESALLPVKDDIARIERELIRNLDTDIPLLQHVLDYILSTSGKRLRPAIHFLTARAFGFSGEAMFLTASLIEYVHTATLLHDDVIDNADFRRSRKSARSIWGNEASVLVGDFLFTESFRRISELNDLALVHMMSEATTLMAKGEIIQLMSSFDKASEEDYLKIIEYKTSTLISLAAKMGVYMGGGSQHHFNAMADFGICFGNAFQIIDDVIDYSSDIEQSGKKQGIDLKERKITLPLCRLLTAAKEADLEVVRVTLQKDEISDDDFVVIKALIGKYGCLEYCLEKAGTFADAAIEKLTCLPDNIYTEALKKLTRYSLTRSS